MGSKPKARTAKSKKKSLPSRKSETTKTQAERFIEAARLSAWMKVEKNLSLP